MGLEWVVGYNPENVTLERESYGPCTLKTIVVSFEQG